jgi:hypothetical protein
LTTDKLPKDEIDSRNFRDSRSRPRPAAASATHDDIVLVVVAVVTVVERFKFGDRREQSFTDGICL